MSGPGFDTVFRAATGNTPYGSQCRLACGPDADPARPATLQGGTDCRSQLINIPTTEQPLSVVDRLRIFQVRGHAVVLDSDLAAVYGVETKVFNQAIRRNAERFPEDFLFRLTREEWTVLRSQCVTLKGSNLKSQCVTSSSHGGRRYAPLVFTEHGAIMGATILNSPRAVAMSVYVVRAFVRLRHELLANATLERRLAHIEKTLIAHDGSLRDIYEKIRPLLLPPPEKPRRRIGFNTDPE